MTTLTKAELDAVFDAHKKLTVTEAVESTLDLFASEELARAACWGWIESAAARCDWDMVRVVIDAFRARYPK